MPFAKMGIDGVLGGTFTLKFIFMNSSSYLTSTFYGVQQQMCIFWGT